MSERSRAPRARSARPTLMPMCTLPILPFSRMRRSQAPAATAIDSADITTAIREFNLSICASTLCKYIYCAMSAGHHRYVAVVHSCPNPSVQSHSNLRAAMVASQLWPIVGGDHRWAVPLNSILRHPAVMLAALGVLSCSLGTYVPGPGIGEAPHAGLHMVLAGAWFSLVRRHATITATTSVAEA